jgi:hypothetical protein
MESPNKGNNMVQIVDVVDNDTGQVLLEGEFLAKVAIVAAREGWEIVRMEPATGEERADGITDWVMVTRPDMVAKRKAERDSLDRAREFWQYGGIDAEINV